MAYQTGTASDHVDLWDKFKAFITSDAELVASGENWEIAWQEDSNSGTGFANDTDYVLRGKGLSDQDSIYIALRRDDSNIANDVSSWYMLGATGVIATANAYNLHVNMTPFPVKMFARPNPMEYWFIANGRRFIIIVQVGTVYETMYGGFFLPYADPTVYTYPLFVGGSSGSGGPSESTTHTSVRDDHTAFCFPSYNSATSASGYNPSAWLMDPSGNWLRCSKDNTLAPVNIGPRFFGQGLGLGADLQQFANSNGYGYDSLSAREGTLYGGGYAMTPMTLTQASPSDQTFGVLDGVYRVSGRSQSILNKLQADNSVHIVFQNTFRTALGEWFAVTRGLEDSNSAFIDTEESNS